MGLVSNTGLLPHRPKNPEKSEKHQPPSLDFKEGVIVTPAPYVLRPYAGLYNPFSNRCSVLCNHPADSEAKECVKRAKAWQHPDGTFTFKSLPNLQEDTADKDRDKSRTSHDLGGYVTEDMFRRYTETDSRPLTPAPTLASGKSRGSRRCLTPDQPRARTTIVLDLRRSHSQETLSYHGYATSDMTAGNTTSLTNDRSTLQSVIQSDATHSRLVKAGSEHLPPLATPLVLQKRIERPTYKEPSSVRGKKYIPPKMCSKTLYRISSAPLIRKETSETTRTLTSSPATANSLLLERPNLSIPLIPRPKTSISLTSSTRISTSRSTKTLTSRSTRTLPSGSTDPLISKSTGPLTSNSTRTLSTTTLPTRTLTSSPKTRTSSTTTLSTRSLTPNSTTKPLTSRRSCLRIPTPRDPYDYFVTCTSLLASCLSPPNSPNSIMKNKLKTEENTQSLISKTREEIHKLKAEVHFALTPTVHYISPRSNKTSMSDNSFKTSVFITNQLKALNLNNKGIKGKNKGAGETPASSQRSKTDRSEKEIGDDNEIYINTDDAGSIERRRGKRRRKGLKSDRLTSAGLAAQTQQDPETQIAGISTDSHNPSSRGSKSPTGARDLEDYLPSVVKTSAQPKFTDSFLDDDILKCLHRDVDEEIIETEFDTKRRYVYEEALRTRPERPFSQETVTTLKEIIVPAVSLGDWLHIPRVFSRQNAQFSLPLDSRLLEELTPMQYAARYVTIKKSKQLLYLTVLKKFKPDGYRMPKQDIEEALMLMTGGVVTAVQVKQFRALMDWDDYIDEDDPNEIRLTLHKTGKNISYFQSGDHADDKESLRYRTWCGLCAICERMYGRFPPRKEDPPDGIEIGDFTVVEPKLPMLKIHSGLLEILHAIRTR